MRDYKNIKAFQYADELVLEIYKITKDFPKEEIYGLTSQIRRAAISVPANIAEGSSRQHLKEYLNFLFVSRGSLSEVEYMLSLACKLGYISDEQQEQCCRMVTHTAKTLYGLIKSVKNDK